MTQPAPDTVSSPVSPITESPVVVDVSGVDRSERADREGVSRSAAGFAGERDGFPAYPRPFTYRSGEAFAADGERVPSWLLNDREEDARCQTL